VIGTTRDTKIGKRSSTACWRQQKHKKKKGEKEKKRGIKGRKTKGPHPRGKFHYIKHPYIINQNAL